MRGQKHLAWVDALFKYKKTPMGTFVPRFFGPGSEQFSTNVLKSMWKRLREDA
jgi:hypothetical protein